MLAEVLTPVLNRTRLLADRVTLIVGADREPGAAITRALAHAGASVVASGDRGDAVSSLADDIDASGGSALACRSAGDEPDVAEAVAYTEANRGRLDSLILVIPNPAPTASNDPDRRVGDRLRRILGPIRAALPALERSDRAAGVVIVRQVATDCDDANAASLSAAEAALDELLGELRRQHPNVTVRSVRTLAFGGRRPADDDIAMAVTAVESFGLSDAWLPIGAGAWTTAQGWVPRSLTDALRATGVRDATAPVAAWTRERIADLLLGPANDDADHDADEIGTYEDEVSRPDRGNRTPEPAPPLARDDEADDSDLTANPSAVRSAAERAAVAARMLGATPRPAAKTEDETDAEV